MSADNGLILRRNAEGKYVLQTYSASADEFPDVERSGENNTFETLEEAVLAAENIQQSEFPVEYGLHTQIGGWVPVPAFQNK